MQLQRPFAVLTPTVDADVLADLASLRADRPHPLQGIVERTGRSRTGVLKALERLVSQGIVLYDVIGGVKTYRLNDGHLLAEEIIAIGGTRTRFLERLRQSCAHIPVEYAALFGSAARGTMQSDSDIDLFFAVTGEARAAAEDRIFDLANAARVWTGNEVSPIIYDATNIDPQDPLISSIAAEGIPLTEDRGWLKARIRKARS
ncbi:nucleotidyltransferase domain-containing protein [Curtobacterium flaccumfaciens]|uniref:nucleotidyltransferase domain-containing protein n=1 Tax=Curtobacterium flaccumfaciens TaxID=2035 RepID=UPI00265AE737|nr:nucleotidyltransferase domain-containing protein [Curtobacterium flaccumfaciens]MCS5518215.1 nucleotidyltransferase domain-containing protein [Curtobacterium flaccumfaciens]